uniref:Uncharacterized protein n=1 Tax=Octopus bimaculoides TaxID=37653 RepID=A0A0L8IIV6_OCTBM
MCSENVIEELWCFDQHKWTMEFRIFCLYIVSDLFLSLDVVIYLYLQQYVLYKQFHPLPHVSINCLLHLIHIYLMTTIL